MSGGERVVWNTMKSELWFVNSCLRVENGQTVSTLPSARSGFNLDAVCRGEAALQRFREAVAPSPSAQEWLYQQGHVAGVQTANWSWAHMYNDTLHCQWRQLRHAHPCSSPILEDSA